MLIAGQPPGGEHVLEAFYDLGLRAGDIVVINPGTFSNESFEYEEIKEKVQEIGMYMISSLPAAWLGDIGEQTRNTLISLYGEDHSNSACFFYDAVYAFALAI